MATDSTAGDPKCAGWLRMTARLQGWFYLISGIWPVVSPATFQAITAPKMDFWLAQTVGLLLALTGLVLLLAAGSGRVSREIVVLGAGSALILAAIDVYCVPEPRTTRAYYLDAVVETALVVSWIVGVLRARAAERGNGRTPL